MIRVEHQLDAGENTLLILDAPIPMRLYNKIKINNEYYKPVIAYDLADSIGIVGKGNFVGQKVEFV